MRAEDFGAFYRAVHTVDPFPWQEELTAQILREGTWPALVDVPTGLGKTSLLDIVLFVTAAETDPGARARAGRRRILFVVDRRLVVDEAFEHASSVLKVLSDPEQGNASPVLNRVRAGLARYAPDAPDITTMPFTLTRMRGGTTWDASWADRPDRVAVVLATVDQVGSRYFFRGYGVAPRRRSIDAALVGTDALLLVDEAHLAVPLTTSLRAAARRDRTTLPLPGLSIVCLSATDRTWTEQAGETTFTLDVLTHQEHPVAGKRLTAVKKLDLLPAAKNRVVKAAVSAVTDHLSMLEGTSPDGWAPVALVVMNTVDDARAVHTQLLHEIETHNRPESAPNAADVLLLIGRSRPADRARIQEQVLQLFGTTRKPRTRAAVLVATQTVEVGVNLDTDLLVTQTAPWDALVQRLGRLNRMGTMNERFPGGTARAVVIHDGSERVPVYGGSAVATWQRLLDLRREHPEGLPVSPLQCRELNTHFADGTCKVALPEIPVLQSPTLDAWARTAPVPLNDPPVHPFLHGMDGGTPPVLIAWRSRLLDEGAPAKQEYRDTDPFDDDFGPVGQNARLAAAWLTEVPIRSSEQVEVPFIAARNWIAGLVSVPIGDVDIGGETEKRFKTERPAFNVLARRVRDDAGQEDGEVGWQWIGADQLRPADEIVVPVEFGGLDPYGWHPSSTQPVQDVSEATTFAPTRSAHARGSLSLDTTLIERLGIAPASSNPGQGQELSGAQTDGPEHDAPGRIHETISDFLAAYDDFADVTALTSELAEVLPAMPPPGRGWTRDSWRRLRRWLDSPPHAVEVLARSDVHGMGYHRLGILLSGRIPSEPILSGTDMPDWDENDEVATSVARPRRNLTGAARQVTLQDHHQAVRARAGQIASALGLPDELRTVVEDAAGWHDLGKTEHRFQVMLHAGDETQALLADEPLAKSGMDPADPLIWRRSRAQSGLPAGARHEAWSSALVQAHLATREAAYPGDTDLLIHLVASHHGHARPLLPAVVDPRPRLIKADIAGSTVSVSSEDTVDLTHPGRFDDLNHRYGRWGLALLETIVRCADMTVSAEGS
nr:type I-U CRISPR-associated helicase/endonuclease Cas3 [Kineosporia babensis]